MTTSLPTPPVDYPSLYTVIDRLAKKLWSDPAGPLHNLVTRALETPSEHPSVTDLRDATVLREPLWAFGTASPGSPGEGVNSLPEACLTTKRRGPAGSAQTVGQLEIFIKDLVAVVKPRARPPREETRAEFVQAAEEFSLLVAVQNVVWAAAVEYDRWLLDHIAEMKTDIGKREPEDLEQEVNELVSLFHGVARFRGGLESLLAHLTRQAHDYWLHIDKYWNLSGYLDAIGTKVDVLVHLHTEVTAAVNSYRTRRLGTAAFAFTSLGVVTVGLALLGTSLRTSTKQRRAWSPLWYCWPSYLP